MALALLSLLHVVILLLSSTLLAESRPYNYTLVKPGCQEYCGGVAIPYPFGIENGNSDCYMNPNFAVTCNNTSDGPPKPFLKSIGMELLGVSMQGHGFVQVNNKVTSSNCGNRKDVRTEVNLSGTPFYYAIQHNRFTVMGCDNYGMLLRDGYITVGCLSICSPKAHISIPTIIERGCYGIECCQTLIPPSMKNFETNITRIMKDGDSSDCRAAFMVDQHWFDRKISVDDYQSYMKSIADMKQSDYVPVVLRWGSYQGHCKPSSVSFCSSNGYCLEPIGQSHLCICSSDYLGSLDSIDYIHQRCYRPDFRSCLTGELCNCRLICADSLESQNCSFAADYVTSYNDSKCFRNHYDMYGTRSRAKIILIGCGSGLGLLFLLIGVWWLYKLIKRRKTMKLKLKFFKRNGGLLLQQQLSSSTTNIEQTKLFSSTELKKATDNFHVNRILGQGGQGTVYKGMLTDGRIVAVKKSKVVDEDKLDQFINEVVILSQINHRNVVKLLGCCLEAEVPLLVYEFISNGTLFHHLHSPNQDFPITWEMRLRIATEIASALSYMHSAASMPIYHRDIKSSNILLDEKFKVKVSDFGTSKSISIDQTHVTTQVQGTLGYLDPEYFQSSQFTDKSDVYSFGVVLIELLTGHRPIFKTQSAKDKNLAYHFLELMEEDRLFEILDAQVTKEATKEEIVAVADIAKRCLNLKGRKRPTMKTIAMELEEIKASKGFAATDKHDDYEEADYMVSTMPLTSWDGTSTSTSFFTSSVRISADADPLLSNT